MFRDAQNGFKIYYFNQRRRLTNGRTKMQSLKRDTRLLIVYIPVYINICVYKRLHKNNYLYSAMKEESKICLQCGKALHGRSDKKFCDDYCRNNYNNVLKSNSNNYMRNINNALSKNRRILEALLQPDNETAKTKKEKLLHEGFSFKYITHIYTTKKGSTYFYCYDFGYLPLDSDWYLVVKKKDE